VEFLTTGTMDVVYEENPNVPLCLFNVFYYNKKYAFNIGMRLKRWVRKNKVLCKDFKEIQKSHLGAVCFDNDTINQFLELL
jgi:hypothetical protein